MDDSGQEPGSVERTVAIAAYDDGTDSEMTATTDDENESEDEEEQAEGVEGKIGGGGARTGSS